jgi:O-methyltransferase involved in polyketide biosynthesis
MRKQHEEVQVTDSESAPVGVDTTTPSVARIYDYLLGGNDNYQVDRETAEKIIAVAPAAPALAKQNRAFLDRAIRFLSEIGIRQFIDIGSGLPTVANVHEVAQRAAPDARVVYVDDDPVVLNHSRELLATNDQAVVIGADMRRPDDILDHPALSGIIDLSQPVAVLFVAVLHCLTDDDQPTGIVSRFRDRIAPGSHIVISHITAQDHIEAAKQGARVYTDAGANAQMTLRDRDQIRNFFNGFDLVEPGLVPLHEWRPDMPSPTVAAQRSPEPLPTWVLCGVGRK